MYRNRARGLLLASAISGLGVVACAGEPPEPGDGDGVIQAHAAAVKGEGEGPAFGPVESREFRWFAGASIERAPDAMTCNYNSDWLMVRGPNVATATLVEISPRTQSWYRGAWNGWWLQGCDAPDCLALYVKVTSRDMPGTRTVTLWHLDGRTATTTFDVLENEGRCDYPRARSP